MTHQNKEDKVLFKGKLASLVEEEYVGPVVEVNVFGNTLTFYPETLGECLRLIASIEEAGSISFKYKKDINSGIEGRVPV